jgi:hypothetical protein
MNEAHGLAGPEVTKAYTRPEDPAWAAPDVHATRAAVNATRCACSRRTSLSAYGAGRQQHARWAVSGRTAFPSDVRELLLLPAYYLLVMLVSMLFQVAVGDLYGQFDVIGYGPGRMRIMPDQLPARSQGVKPIAG